jgi:hypothetical protein
MADIEIVCPIRNGGQNFSATLASLRAQGGANRRLLISDNFSSDAQPWRTALEEMKDWSIRIVQPPQELGRVEHWSWACGQSDAEIVKLVMAGDRLERAALDRFEKAFETSPACSFAFGQTRIREHDKELTVSPPCGAGELEWSAFVELSLAHFNFTGTLSAVAFRRDFLRDALPFDARWPWTADWRLLAACCRKGPGIYIAEPVCVLDRTLGRYSSRTSTIGPSLREEWVFLTELSRERYPEKRNPLFWSRLKQISQIAATKYGRAVLPAWFRKPLGACYRSLAQLRHR